MSGRVATLDRTAGTATVFRFRLRRERLGLPIWVIGATLLVAVQSTQSQDIYSDPGDLAELRATSEGNPAFTALTGPVELLDTIGGEVVFEIYSYVAIVIGLMNMFLVGRNTRSDEEAGRAELIRSAVVGRDAQMVAALLLAATADVAVAVAVAAAAIGTGLPVSGSILLGLSLGSCGLVFAALTALAAQIFESSRATYGTVGSALGVFFALRAVGDASFAPLSWLSPIGWGQQSLPYVADRWWPLVLPVVTAAALAAGAFAVLERRDFGAGLVGQRPGSPVASPLLSTPAGLAWRLQRGSIYGWTVGTFATGAMFGSLGRSMVQYATDNPDVVKFLPGGADQILDSYFVLSYAMTSLLAGAAGVAAVLRARTEETAGRAEPVLATPTSRWSWFGGHLLTGFAGGAVAALAGGFGVGLAYGLSVSDTGEIGRLTAMAVVWVPGVWVFAAVAALGVGGAPKLAAAISWTLIAYATVIMFFADSFDLPRWSRAVSPLYHTPQVPLADLAAGPLLGLIAAATAATVVGAVALRRRDLETH